MDLKMDYRTITEQKAIEMLKVWSYAGRDLASLVKLHTDNSKKIITIVLPDYCDNEWYQIGKTYSCYKEALGSFGYLLDKIRTSA